MGTSINLLAIKTKSGIYISDNIESNKYFNSQIPPLLFDGERAAKTYLPDWFLIRGLPELVQKALPEKIINRRYELKAGYPISELTPSVLKEDPNDEDSSFYDVRNLYFLNYEKEPGGMEEVEIKLTIISEEDNFKIVKQDFPVSYGILDKITVNPVLLPIKPCLIKAANLYRIIREHVKKHIDGKYARITSDYDFCFTVQKSIKLSIPHAYKQDIGTKRRPNIITKYNNDRMVEVFQMAPSPYQNYTVLEPIRGETYEDLQNKITKYLNDLMDVINQPIKECPHCNGSGMELDKITL